jgi:hypothetical protein
VTELIIQPDTAVAPIQKHGIFTIRREDARLECNCPHKRGMGCGGIAVDDVPLQHRSFQLLCQDYAKRFISRMRARGYEYVDGGDVVFHGPFSSYELNKNLADIGSSQWGQAMYRDKADNAEHPERVLPFVFERNPLGEYVDYVLVATFTVRDVFTDIPLEEVRT